MILKSRNQEWKATWIPDWHGQVILTIELYKGLDNPSIKGENNFQFQVKSMLNIGELLEINNTIKYDHANLVEYVH